MDQARWLDEDEMRAWRSLLGAHRRLLQRLDTELQTTQGMSVSDYGVLVELSEADEGRLRMSELAERMLLSPSGLTRRLDTLVQSGLVERVRCPTDRRGAFAVITPAGRERLARAAPDHIDQVRRHFVDRLSRRQLVELAQALEAVVGDEATSSCGAPQPAESAAASAS